MTKKQKTRVSTRDTGIRGPLVKKINGDQIVLWAVQFSNENRAYRLAIKPVGTTRFSERTFVKGLLWIGYKTKEPKDVDNTIEDFSSNNEIVAKGGPISTPLAISIKDLASPENHAEQNCLKGECETITHSRQHVQRDATTFYLN
jgi:hypothetical protein